MTRKYRRTTGIQGEVSKEGHKKLRQLCDQNNLSLKLLTAQLLEWAADKTAEELTELGVQIPVMPKRGPISK